MHQVCIIRGDGIGPEISDAVEKIIAASGVQIDWIPLDAGLKCVEAGEPIVPDRTIDKIRDVEFTTLIFSSDDLSKTVEKAFPDPNAGKR